MGGNATCRGIRIFLCACGRQQAYAPAGVSGGVTWAEALGVGWSGTEAKPVCPFCTNPALLTRRD